MKKIKLISILVALALSGLSACDNANKATLVDKTDNTQTKVDSEKKTYTVIFNTNGGSSISPTTVKENDTVKKPADPTKDGYTFGGWFTDENLSNPMNFSSPINKNTTLYAKWYVKEVPPSPREFVVTFNTNGGNTIASVTVVENEKLNKPADPNRTGYKFNGWYVDSGFTTPMNFNNPITATLTLYAKWEKIDDTTYGIVDRDFKIPTNLTFSTVAHTSSHSSVIECGSLPNSGTFNQNFDKESNATVCAGISVIKYRYKVSNGKLNLFADNTYYNGTSYHGREGSIFNVLPLGGINKVTVNYSASYSASSNKGYQYTYGELIEPNIRFGNDPSCSDYVYFLNPLLTSGTCDVNLSGYEYFSVCTGSYNLSLSTINVDYDDNSTSTRTYSAVAGNDKVRINPIKYTYTLVPGESKITVPLETKYDSATGSYTVTKSKELTYYTTNYVRNHSECIEDAAITDPILICAYYTAFKKWPANFSESTGSVRSIFGSNARQVSTYSRTDGYVRAVPWSFEGKYYEFDIDLDGSYENSRGSGRVVAWESGWSETGYDDSPACIYTDDHYNTFIEYLNNGTWSRRFNAEGLIAGIKYSRANTVTLSNFDPHMVEGTSSGQGGGAGEEEKQIDDNDYYANFAPEKIINEQTALYQQVTNASGIKKHSVYAIVNKDYCEMYQNFCNFSVNETTHSLTFPSYEAQQEVSKFYIEIVSDTTCYIYRFSYNSAYYIGSPMANDKRIVNYSFDAYGNFNICYNNEYLRYNPNGGNGLFRFYGEGKQKPIQLYRLCDIKDATPLEENYQNINFNLLTDLSNNDDVTDYMIVSENYSKSLFSDGKFIVDSVTKELKVTENSYCSMFKLIKHPDYDGYYCIFDMFYAFLSFDSTNPSVAKTDYTTIITTIFEIEFESDVVKIKPFSVEDGTPTPYLIDGEECYLAYIFDRDCFGYTADESEIDLHLYEYIPPEPEPHTEYSKVYSTDSLVEGHDFILVSVDGQTAFGDNTDAVYSYNDFNEFVIDGTPSYKLLHFKKHEIDNVYSISYDVNGATKYVCVNEETKEVYEGDEPNYYEIGFYGIGMRITLTEIYDGHYEIVNYRTEYPYLNYDLDSGEFKLCHYTCENKLELYEVVTNWY